MEEIRYNSNMFLEEAFINVFSLFIFWVTEVISENVITLLLWTLYHSTLQALNLSNSVKGDTYGFHANSYPTSQIKIKQA